MPHGSACDVITVTRLDLHVSITVTRLDLHVHSTYRSISSRQSRRLFGLGTRPRHRKSGDETNAHLASTCTVLCTCTVCTYHGSLVPRPLPWLQAGATDARVPHCSRRFVGPSLPLPCVSCPHHFTMHGLSPGFWSVRDYGPRDRYPREYWSPRPQSPRKCPDETLLYAASFLCQGLLLTVQRKQENMKKH